MNNIFGKWVLDLLPKQTLTSLVGRAARRPWSRWLIPWYVHHYQIDVTQAELTPDEYRTLVDFFARRLKSSARPIAEQGIVSPVDGAVSELGCIAREHLLQAKGAAYTLSALLANPADARIFEGGHYITLYLSPRDYHRIHVPLSGVLKEWRYIPGTLYPVNPFGVRNIPGLFTKNERMVTFVDSNSGRYAIVKIGATIVGSIRTDYGPDYSLPRRRAASEVQSGCVEIELERGAEVGRFEFGSTVILLFQPGMLQSFEVQTGDVVRMGERIACTVSEDGPS